MRLFSPLCIIIFIVTWSVFFLLIARYFLYGAHQSWFKEEEQKLLSSVEFKIDNFDARNMRQLNHLYEEAKRLEDLLIDMRKDLKRRNFTAETQKISVPLPRVKKDNNLEPVIAILVIACNREDYVRQTLDTLLEYRPSAGLFPIVVSQDCGHHQTANAIDKYGSRITHIKHPDLSEVNIPSSERKIKNKRAEMGYYKISRHYKWALTQIFDEMKYEYVIIVEDDLLIAVDFYNYFSSLRVLMDSDPTIMCVSAWNDNGKEGYINHEDNDLLYRTDFFPGLGWMLNKQLWQELKPKWPSKFWDDWMREPQQRMNRACIRPEVSRTKTVGKKGVSNGEYYMKHLQFISLNNNPVDFTKKNLSYLHKDMYDRIFVDHVNKLPLITKQQLLSGTFSDTEVRVEYLNSKDFQSLAKQLKIMHDLRAGVPRTAYKGIVTFVYNKKRIHLVPHEWNGYTVKA